MNTLAKPIVERSSNANWRVSGAAGFFFAVLAWAPFPLGSNRPWSCNLLITLIALCWILWGLATWNSPNDNWILIRRYKVACVLAVCAIGWAIMQTLPVVPADWAHPVFGMASLALGRTLPATISINPWHTGNECLKLCAWVMVLWLAYTMALRIKLATLLLDAIISIGVVYALYSAVLKFAGFSQFELFYKTSPVIDSYFSGPFVLHNSYATFAGLIALASIARLASLGRTHVVSAYGLRRMLLSALQFLFGRGFGYMFGFLVTFSTLLASASRAGFLATSCGLLVMLVLAAMVGPRAGSRRWLIAATFAIFPIVIGLAFLNGDALADRLNTFVDTGKIDPIRLALWDAALRMIHNAPLLGLGLGTFSDSYPQYAVRVFPLAMDKAHNDFLEFAAGLGLPAAVAWWTAWFLLALACGIGAFRRRRDRHLPILALGATVLVAVHSIFDFSLQIPAVAIFYAAILGVGLAQARSPRSARL